MKKTNILVVDDEQAILELFQSIFADEKYKVKTVNNGEKAITSIKDKDYDIVFLDIVMYGMDGVTVLGEIKKIKPKTNVVMMSGNIMEDHIIDVAKKNGDGFISKPFNIKNIIKYVENLELWKRGKTS